jgi:8-oxo-dGTP pyrophosphatase MutT (NUDIX family)
MFSTPFEPNEFPARLAKLLNAEPAAERRRGFAPSMAYGRHAGPARYDARPAAVLFLLYPLRSQWYLPLTRRQSYLPAHGGQVSLPGGAIEAGESTWQAAAREAEEELGVSCGAWRSLGSLPPLYLFNSNYQVTPWVAAAPARPAFAPNTAEVAELVELPLQALLDADPSERMPIKRGELTMTAPCLPCQAGPVWGATRILLGEFTGLLRQVAADQHV